MVGTTRRILLVEDEPILAISLQDIVEALGYQVIGPAMRVAAALDLVEIEAFDAAILDVNMGDGDSYQVADRLRGRGIPFLFATGYGREGIAAGYDRAAVLQKPYRESQVANALAAILP